MGRTPIAPKVEKSCQWCGGTWMAYATIDKRKFCSTKCGAAGRTGKSAGKGVPRSGRPRSTPRETVPCPRCKTPFERYVGDGKPQSIYCSSACYHASRVGVSRPDLYVAPETKYCEHCAAPFLVGGEGRKARSHRYCSRACAKSAYWQGDRAQNWSLLPGSHGPARQLSDTEAAWFAGLIDGEGCIAWPRRHILHSVRLDVANTNQELMKRVCEVTGTGRVQAATRVKDHHTQAFIWHAYGDNARYLLHQILPFLINKKYAAEVALGLIAASEPPTSTRSMSLVRRDAKPPTQPPKVEHGRLL